MIEISTIILGAIVAYPIVSITEALSHKYLLHANKHQIRRWQRLGWLGNYIYTSWYSHFAIHHCKTFKQNHVTQFDNKPAQVELNEWLIKNGRKQVILDSYGLRIGSLNQKTQYTYTHILPSLILCAFGGVWFSIGVMAVLLFYIFMAEYVHPYIHLPIRQALTTASPLMKRFITSRYFNLLSQQHFLHHKYDHCNFNLVLGGDYLLGFHRPANQQDIQEMKKIGLIA